MFPFDFHCPTRIVFGPGRIDELGELTAGLSVKRALVVSDPGIEEVGHTQRAIDSLQAAGLDTLVFDRLQENPTTDNVDDGRAVAADYQPDVIVAVGGGSSMDCAKGINFLHSCGGRMHDYWGVGKATGPMLPMVAVPTTAGTGSEAQSFALISDAVTHAKMACGDKRAAFGVAVLDPELTLTQPPRLTALTGMDAISHAVETLVTKKRNQISMAFSREAWRLLTGGFRRVIADPDDLTARGWMQQGACLAGLAIENSMLGGAHALANPVTAAFGVTHGEAVGVMLPRIVRHNGATAAGVSMAYAELVVTIADREFSGGASAAADGGGDEDVLALADYLGGLARDAGLAGKLSDCGVTRDRLPALAADAARQWTGTFNPVEMTADDYLKCYEAAF
ncbi:MAG: iron-containing alcohol dehydrogenase [Planctomycetota bacterium]